MKKNGFHPFVLGFALQFGGVIGTNRTRINRDGTRQIRGLFL